MSFVKYSILLALTTTLTACATSYTEAPTVKEGETDFNSATIKMVKGFHDTRRGNRASLKEPFYKICDTVQCVESDPIKFFPLRSKETEGMQITPNEPISVIAGLKSPYNFKKDIGPFAERKICTSTLVFTPEAGKSYQVTLMQGSKQTCSLNLIEA